MRKFESSGVHRFGSFSTSFINNENVKALRESEQRLGRVVELTNKCLYNPYCEHPQPCDHLCPVNEDPVVTEETEPIIQCQNDHQESCSVKEESPDWNPPFCLSIEDPILLTEDIYSCNEDFTMDRSQITPSIKRSNIDALRSEVHQWSGRLTT